MNRAVLFGIATLVVIVGISLLGSEKEAVAGFGCHGCCGVSACDGGGCGGGLFNRCGGRRHHCGGGLFNRCGGRRQHCGGLFGRRNDCCGAQDACPPADCNPCPPAPCGCSGGTVVPGGEMMEGQPTPAPGVPEAPAVPDAPAAPEASAASFRTISFVK